MGVTASKKVSASSHKRKEEVKNIWWINGDRKKHGALHYAVISKCAQTVESVIKKGVLLDEQDSGNGMTAVHLAVYLDLADVVMVLIENGVDVNIPDEECITPLICAIKRENTAIAKQLLNAGADPLKSDKNGNSALHYAARFSASSVELLLSLGFNVNIPNKNCITPLMYAIKENNIEIVKQLLNGGAKRLVTDCDGETPLHYAVRYSELSVELLLSKGVSVNIPVKQRLTPLMVAIKEGNINIVKLLLNSGAEPMRPNLNGETALHYAARYSVSSLKPLLPKVFNVDIPHKEYITPLMIAIKEGNVEIVELLLNRGAEPMISDCRGEAALHYAVKYSVKLVNLLMSKGVEVNIIGQCENPRESKSPLMIAVESEDLSTLLLLLNKGADVNLRSGGMRTALHFAKSGHMVEMLCEWGADINAWDMDGKTPLLSAMARDNLEVIEALLCYGPPPSDYGSFIRRSCPSTTRSVNEIIIKFKQVYSDNIDYSTLDLLDSSDSEGFASQCSLEVKSMKEARFGRQSLFLMLIRGPTDCMFAANTDMCKFIEDEQFKHNFPLYHTILRRYLRIAKRRFSLLRDSIGILISFMEINCQNLTFPEEVCDKILSYLSMADMIRFNRTLDHDFEIEADAEDILLH